MFINNYRLDYNRLDYNGEDYNGELAVLPHYYVLILCVSSGMLCIGHND